MREVNIHLNDELGYEDSFFSIEPSDDVGNWIDSFNFPEEVKKYCKKNDLKIVKFYNTIHCSNKHQPELFKKVSEMIEQNFFEI
jgi:hypothetical protein